MSKKRLLSGILLYTLGLSVLALGVAVSVQARLGVSPINSLPYVLSLLTPLNMGRWVTTVFILFILVQLVGISKNLMQYSPKYDIIYL